MIHGYHLVLPITLNLLGDWAHNEICQDHRDFPCYYRWFHCHWKMMGSFRFLCTYIHSRCIELLLFCIQESSLKAPTSFDFNNYAGFLSSPCQFKTLYDGSRSNTTYSSELHLIWLIEMYCHSAQLESVFLPAVDNELSRLMGKPLFTSCLKSLLSVGLAHRRARGPTHVTLLALRRQERKTFYSSCPLCSTAEDSQ